MAWVRCERVAPKPRDDCFWGCRLWLYFLSFWSDFLETSASLASGVAFLDDDLPTTCPILSVGLLPGWHCAEAGWYNFNIDSLMTNRFSLY